MGNQQITSLPMGQKFKRIPFGDIPFDWEIKSLKEIGSVTDGDWILNTDYAPAGVRLLQIGDIGVGKFIGKSKRFISEKRARELGCNLLKAGDILISRMPDPIGRACILPELGGPSITAVDVTIWRPNPATNDRQFLTRCLNSSNWFALVTSYSAGSTRTRISRSLLEAIEIPFPPLREQRRIAEMLSSVDDAIGKTNAIIEKIEKMKLGLMQQLFTKGVAGHQKYRVTELGRIPESWDLQPCEKLCELITVGIVIQPARLYTESGVPCLRSLNIHEDAISDDRMVFIFPEANAAHSKSTLKEGDVVAVRTGYPGTACVVPKKYDGANCVDLVIMRPGKRLTGTFLSRFINSPAGRKQVLRGQGGLAQQHFNVGEVCKMLIPVPPINEQDEISDLLIAAHDVVNKEKENQRNLESLKSGLMRVLLTGKVRVRII